MMTMTTSEFTAEEAAALAPYVTNVEQPVFALINLPETVKGALFARYSRSAKSVRRLLLDEFMDQLQDPAAATGTGPVKASKADALYQRVFNDYGDDSVAQLGGVHLACEDVSNLLTKVLERGRLAAYLEQSTRYIPYTQRRNDHWRRSGKRCSRADRGRTRRNTADPGSSQYFCRASGKAAYF